MTPSWPWRRHDRRLRLFGVGNEKTGTHSIAGLFSAYRSAHEPEVPELRALVSRSRRGQLRPGELERYLRSKDRRLRLEVDSSFLNGEVIDTLARCYPRAKHVLTVREPRSWLDSMINQTLSYRSLEWLDLRALRVGTTAPHPAEEQALADRGLSTLDAYFGEWARHNRRVLENVPPEHLLVLRTEEIGDRIADLAAFAGVPAETLALDRSHEFRGPVKHHVLDGIDDDHLRAKIEQHCGALFDRLLSESHAR